MATTRKGTNAGRPGKPADPNFPKRRATREAKQAGTLTLDPPANTVPETPEQTASQAPVGLSPDPPEVKDSEPEIDTYHCGNCKGQLEYGMPRCPTCKAGLKWS